MSTTNKKKNISETLLEMDRLTKAIKEESKETISQLLSEAVRGAINESIGEEDEEDYEIEDDATNDMDFEDEQPEDETDGTQEDAPETDVDMDMNMDAETEGDEEGDEWSSFEDFKVGDDTYDLTSEKGDEAIVKVYKLLKDEDQVVVRQDGDTVSLTDNETGAEYVIKTGCETPECETEEPSFEFEGEESTEDDVETPETDFEPEMGENEENNDEEDETMKEGKEIVYEIDLGYTDSYQDKDPIKGLNNNEPSKSGKSWHKGVPTGTQKPWAGKGSSKPFEKKTACCEGEDLNLDMPVDETPVAEGTNVTLPNRRKKVKSHSMQQKDYPKVAHQDSKNAEYKALEETCKRLQKENKELKAIIPQIKKAMNESVIVNYKLGRIVKLFSENTTTKKEKIDIINRFNEEAKTINETKALYESVKRELNSAKQTTVFDGNS